jgi:hypothetical protein
MLVSPTSSFKILKLQILHSKEVTTALKPESGGTGRNKAKAGPSTPFGLSGDRYKSIVRQTGLMACKEPQETFKP